MGHFWYQFVRFLGCKLLTVMLLLDFNMTEISWIMNLDFGCWIRETGTWKKPVLPTVDGVSNPAAKMYSIRSWQIWDFHPSMSWILVTPFSKLHFGKCLNFYWKNLLRTKVPFGSPPLQVSFPFFCLAFFLVGNGKTKLFGSEILRVRRMCILRCPRKLGSKDVKGHFKWVITPVYAI